MACMCMHRRQITSPPGIPPLALTHSHSSACLGHDMRAHQQSQCLTSIAPLHSLQILAAGNRCSRAAARALHHARAQHGKALIRLAHRGYGRSVPAWPAHVACTCLHVRTVPSCMLHARPRRSARCVRAAATAPGQRWISGVGGRAGGDKQPCPFPGAWVQLGALLISFLCQWSL